MSAPRITLKTTNDGSHTVHSSQFDADYHSIHGALQEALHVYIKNGLHQSMASPIHILEIGFGTGLNMLLSILHKSDTPLFYTSLEPYPIEQGIIDTLNYANTKEESDLFKSIHQAKWNTTTTLSESVTIEKVNARLEGFESSTRYDVVYYDAFGPNAQPEMWGEKNFKKVYSLMSPGARLVTFCAQGKMKRTLKHVGFTVSALPGPPGKREMTVGIKT